MPGAPLSLPDREEISVALIEDRSMSWAVIARRVGRAPSTISREVTRNGGRGRYRPAVAQARAESCRQRPKQRVLARPGPLRDRVTAELALGRSLDAIRADLAAEGLERVCTETIYQGVYNDELDVKATDCLRSRRPRRRSRQARHQARNKAHWPSILGRPAGIGDRSEPGHWEADLIIGAHNRSAMLWLSERVTRYAIGVAMPNGYRADDTLTALIEALEHVPPHLALSVTFDRGSEWTDWKSFADYHDLNVWFCEPHSPWQRGQIENQNRQWRWCYPRGTNLSIITQDHINHTGALVSAVPFLDRDFAFRFFPWIKVACGQVNYRAYGSLGAERGVWFFGTSLDSAFVALPRYAWQMPWHRDRIRITPASNSSAGATGGLGARTEVERTGAWGGAELRLVATGERIGVVRRPLARRHR